MESNEYDSIIWRQGHIEKFSVSWYETVLAKMEREFDIVVVENEKLKKQLEAIKQVAIILEDDLDCDFTLLCCFCKHYDSLTSHGFCGPCQVSGNMGNWQPPEVGE